MEACVLVDSNVHIGLLRRGIDPAGCLGEWIGAGDLATCGMVRLEVERGVKGEKARRSVALFFDVMVNAPTSNRVWEHAKNIAWRLDRSGCVIPAQDILIGACALALGAVVLTDDAHFGHIPGLATLRPADELDAWQ